MYPLAEEEPGSQSSSRAPASGAEATAMSTERTDAKQMEGRPVAPKAEIPPCILMIVLPFPSDLSGPS